MNPIETETHNCSHGRPPEEDQLQNPGGEPGENQPLNPGEQPGENQPLNPGGEPGENQPLNPGEQTGENQLLNPGGQPGENQPLNPGGQPSEHQPHDLCGQPGEYEPHNLDGKPGENQPHNPSGKQYENQPLDTCAGQPGKKQAQSPSGKPGENRPHNPGGKPVNNQTQDPGGEQYENQPLNTREQPGENQPQSPGWKPENDHLVHNLSRQPGDNTSWTPGENEPQSIGGKPGNIQPHDPDEKQYENQPLKPGGQTGEYQPGEIQPQNPGGKPWENQPQNLCGKPGNNRPHNTGVKPGNNQEQSPGENQCENQPLNTGGQPGKNQPQNPGRQPSENQAYGDPRPESIIGGASNSVIYISDIKDTTCNFEVHVHVTPEGKQFDGWENCVLDSEQFCIERFNRTLSALIESEDVDVIGVEKWPVKLIMRAKTRKGLDKLWMKCSSGEMDDNLTGILGIIDPGDHSLMALQAKMLESNYRQGCRFFTEWKKGPFTDIHLHITPDEITNFLDFLQTNAEFLSSEICSLCELDNSEGEIKLVGIQRESLQLITRVKTRRALDGLFVKCSSGELAEKLVEIFGAEYPEDERVTTLQVSMLKIDYSQGCRFFTNLKKGNTPLILKGRLPREKQPHTPGVPRLERSIKCPTNSAIHISDVKDSTSNLGTKNQTVSTRKKRRDHWDQLQNPSESHHQDVSIKDASTCLDVTTEPVCFEFLQGMPACPCGNSNSTQFRPYSSSNSGDDQLNRIIGICCTVCHQEWLEDRLLVTPDLDGLRPAVELDGIILKRQSKRDLQSFANEVFRVSPNRTIINDFDDLGSHLNVGDHITWELLLFKWHDAIVTGVDTKGYRIQVINWDKQGGKLKIVSEWKDVRKQTGTLYRIDYPEEILSANPAEIVIARATSRLSEVGYGLFTENNESFASRCKSGLIRIPKDVQLERKREAIFTETLVQFAKEVAHSDSVECNEHDGIFLLNVGLKPSTSQEIVLRDAQLGIKLLIEGVYCVWDLGEIYQHRKDGDMDREVFIEHAYSRVSKVLFSIISGDRGGVAGIGSVLGSIVGGVAGTLVLPVFGTHAGLALGGLVGSMGGLAAGFGVGKKVGQRIDHSLIQVVGTNDRLVLIEELNSGDHIVLFRSLEHPRHHAIVVSVNTTYDSVAVVHATCENCVREEQVDFVGPVYRVVYDDGNCHPPDEVIRRARSKIFRREGSKKSVADDKYCYFFACWCKLL